MFKEQKTGTVTGYVTTRIITTAYSIYKKLSLRITSLRSAMSYERNPSNSFLNYGEIVEFKMTWLTLMRRDLTHILSFKPLRLRAFLYGAELHG